MDVADAVDGQWESEYIPDDGLLYMRVHHVNIDVDGKPTAGAFKEHNGGMSTNWNKYSTPEATRSSHSNPANYAVVEMSVAEVRTIPDQRVEHTPLSDNRAHTDVIGEKKSTEVRFLFRRSCRMVLEHPG